MINGQKEIWISTSNKSKCCSTIIAVSNCGRIMRKNGKIEIASCRQIVFVGEKRLRMLMYRFLANNLIVKTEDDILKQRTLIDHITHTPNDMYINDVRNLRWCTQKENCNFNEVKLNKSKSQKGKKHSIETKEKMSKSHRGHFVSDATKEKMSKAKIGHIVSNDTKAKMSADKLGTHWYNNGTINVRSFTCPEGFVKGRLKHGKTLSIQYNTGTFRRVVYN